MGIVIAVLRVKNVNLVQFYIFFVVVTSCIVNRILVKVTGSFIIPKVYFQILLSLYFQLFNAVLHFLVIWWEDSLLIGLVETFLGKTINHLFLLLNYYLQIQNLGFKQLELFICVRVWVYSFSLLVTRGQVDVLLFHETFICGHRVAPEVLVLLLQILTAIISFLGFWESC